jgi:L-ribulose-5-phosphate 4-epimerase
MLEALKKEVCQANLNLVKSGLVLLTWGNASGFDKESGLMVIKPSGVAYDNMTYENMVIVDMDGNVVEGSYRPSSDTDTHIEIYKAFGVGGIVHTHSKWGTIWSQAGVEIPYLGTTHADNFYGNIPCTRALTDDEINGKYEKETGNVIVKTFEEKQINPNNVPGVVITNHAPFAWGKTAAKAVENAVVLEYVAEMAYYTLDLNKDAEMRKTILDKHFLRKHGANAYYGQDKK